jgi:hypothetical protein
MRSRVFSAVWILAGGAVACGSGGASSAPLTDAGGDAFVCTDTNGGNVTANIDDVFNTTGLACPLAPDNTPLPYDMAIYSNCGSLGMTSGDVQYGQCLGYLVWEVDVDSSGHNFSKCYYDVQTRALVGVVFGDGQADQCGNASYTIQAGSVQPCAISGLSSQGAGGLFEDCSPKPDGGSD